jgi:hypothetical protein
MSDEKVLSILLKLGLDRSASEQAQAGLQKYRNQMDALAKDAQDVKTAIDVALAHGEDTSKLTQNLKSVEKELENVGKQAKTSIEGELGASMRKSMEQTYQFSERLGQASQIIGMVGAAGVAAYVMAAQKYASSLSDVNKATDPYSQALAKMEAANLRAGKVAADALAPWVDQLAKGEEFMVNIAEKTPLLAQGVLAVSGLLAGGGGLGKLVADGVRVYADVKLLGAAALFSQAADKMLLAAGMQNGNVKTDVILKIMAALLSLGKGVLATGVAGAVTGGVVLGLGANEIAARNGGPNAQANQWATVGAYKMGQVFGKMFGFDEKEIEQKALIFARSVGVATGAISEGAAKAPAGLSSFAAKNVQLFIDFEKQKNEAAQQYGEQSKQIEADAAQKRIEIIQSFAERAAQAEANYQHTTAKAQSDFAKTNLQAVQDYHRQAADATQQFNVDQARAQQDHQREMQRLEDDHNTRVRDLVGAQDAFGLMKENESYAKQKGQAESDFDTASSRRKEDFARQMAEMTENFNQQRNQRAQEFAAQQNERAQQHIEEMNALRKEKADQLALLDKSTNDQLTKLRDAYQKQVATLENALVDQLNKLINTTQATSVALSDWQKQQILALEAFMKARGMNVDGTPLSGDKAFGGPVYSGKTYMVGERGPELFTPRGDGSIIPNGLTAAMLNPRSRNGGARNMTVRIESSSLTMTEILSEVDRRFARFERGFAEGFA